MNFFEKPKLLTFIIIALLVLNFATLAFMWLHRPPHPREMGPDMDRMHEGPPGHERERDGRQDGKPADFIEHELNFNQQQQADFEKLKKEHQDIMKQVH